MEGTLANSLAVWVWPNRMPVYEGSMPLQPHLLSWRGWSYMWVGHHRILGSSTSVVFRNRVAGAAASVAVLLLNWIAGMPATVGCH